MRLSDIMSAAGLHSWAEVGLVISFVAFLAIVIYVFARRKGAWDRAKALPLDDQDVGPRHPRDPSDSATDQGEQS